MMNPSFHTPDQARPRRAIDRKAVTACLLALATVLQAASGLDTLEAQTRKLPAPEQTQAAVSESALLRVKLDEAQAALNRLQAESASSTNLPPGATETEAIEYRSLLQLTAKTYQTHLDYLAAIEDTRQRRRDFERAAQTWTGFSDPPPYSILFVDDLRDAVQALEEKIKLSNTALAFAEKLTSHFEAALKGHEGDLRRLSERLEEEKDRDRIVRLSWERDLASGRSHVAAATLASFDTLRQKASEELAEHRMRLDFARKQVTLASRQIRFTKSDLERALAALDVERRRLEAEVQSAYAELAQCKAALAEARGKLNEALKSPAERTAATPSIRRLQDVVEVRDTQVQTASEMISGIRQLLDGVTLDHQLWQVRFTLFSSHNLEEIQLACRRLDKLSDLVASGRQYFGQKAALTASQVVEQQNSLADASESQRDGTLAREGLESLQKRALIYRRLLESVEKRERLILRWKESLEQNRKALPFLDRLRDLCTETSGFAAKLWNFELFVAEDTLTVDGQTIKGRRGVTVGKIMRVVLFLVVGYWLSSLVARGVQRLTTRRLRMERNQANLIRRWVCIALMTGVVVFSLILVKIPLTVFTFAGGALAIGLGFGTQNLIKNFISGIIILFERPFRVGDVLDIDGRRGTVTSIGIRSSVVLFWDGTETLIPNSSLLENNLTNWTFSNQTVRFTLTVGVAYGTDTTHVSRLLAEIVERHGLVQKTPAPQVLFTDFSDSTLCFEIRFWVDVAKHNASQVGSDLRHMIAKTFAEHGISMAFPQRDLHWDAKPLEVRLTRAKAAGSDAPEGKA